MSMRDGVSKKKKLKVPYRKQKNDYLCSEASVSMVFKYYNITISQSKIDGGLLEDMKPYVSQFLNCELKQKGSIKQLQKEIDKDRPIIVRIVPENQKERHAIVITGYSKRGFYIHDPASKTKNKLITYSEFSKLWKKTDNLFMRCQKR